MNIIDIHTHILFGVDDGAKTLEQMLEMLDMAYSGGTRTVIFTPHNSRSHFDYEKANNSLQNLAPIAKERYPEMSFCGGCELLYSPSAFESLQDGKIPTLADSSYLLVEFMPGEFYSQILKAVRDIVTAGYIPILAHTERYVNVTVENVRELINYGALIQLNGRSVIGESGRSFKKSCAKLLKQKLVHFIASDAHDTDKKTPDLSECANYIVKKYGQEYAANLFEHNPMKILNNKPI